MEIENDDIQEEILKEPSKLHQALDNYTFKGLEERPVSEDVFGNGYIAVDHLKQVSPSQHVILNRGIAFRRIGKVIWLHHAVVENVNIEDNTITVIHFPTEGQKIVRSETIQLGEQRVDLCLYRQKDCVANEEVLAVANALKGFSRYNKFICNDWHFATLCKIGKCSSSRMVDHLINNVINDMQQCIDTQNISKAEMERVRKVAIKVAKKERVLLGLFTAVKLIFIRCYCQAEARLFENGEIDEEDFNRMVFNALVETLEGAQSSNSLPTFLTQIPSMQVAFQTAKDTLLRLRIPYLVCRLVDFILDAPVETGAVAGVGASAARIAAVTAARGAARSGAIGLAVAVPIDVCILTRDCLDMKERLRDGEITQKDFDNFVGENVARRLFNLGGGFGGAVAGAAIGAVGGPIGIAIGGVVGGVAGSGIGYGVGFGAGKAGVALRNAIEDSKERSYIV